MIKTPTTIVLIPGLICDGWMWGHQAAGLSEFGEIFLADLRGYNSITDMAAAMLEQTSGPLSVAGHSMGGRVAFEMVRMAPERVIRLAALDTGYAGVKPTEAANRGALVDLAREEGMTRLAEKWLPPMMHPMHQENEDLMRDLVDMVKRSSVESFAGQQQALLTRPDATDLLSQINCPTTLICGLQDQWSPLSQHQEMADKIPGSKVVGIDECGHMSLVEQAEAVTKALRDWMVD